jgi:Protein of unknown function (DUF2800)
MRDSERLDLPSASSARRRRLCVGSENLIRALAEHNLLAEIPAGPDAESGQAVHAAWAGEPVKLNGNQALTLEDLQRLEQMLVADWSAGEEVYLIGREERLWLRQRLEPLMSGQYDVAYGKRNGKSVLILDAKTLYGEIDPAEYNDQLRELVALFFFNYPATEHFRVAILSPKLQERCTVADYDRTEAMLAYRLLKLSLAESAQPEAIRTPGAHCGKCPARLNCEEARQMIGNTYNLAKRIESGEFRIPLGEKGARIIENIKSAKVLLKGLEDRYKQQLLDEPDSIPGWRMKEGKKIRVISEVDKALKAAKANWFSDEDFWACCDVAIGRLQEKLGTVAQVSGKGLARRFNEAFGPLVTYKQYGPELEKIGKKKGELEDESTPDPDRLVSD